MQSSITARKQAGGTELSRGGVKMCILYEEDEETKRMKICCLSVISLSRNHWELSKKKRTTM